MTNLRIPGYRTISSNEVFGKKGEPIINPMFPIQKTTTEVIYLQRYKIPTIDGVVQSIITSAKEVKNMHNKDFIYTFPELVKIFNEGKKIGIINLEDITKLAEGEEEIIEHLKGHIPRIDFQQNRVYLRIYSGRFLDEFLDDEKEKIKSQGNNTYESLIQQFGGNSVILTIRLQDHRTLPEIKEAEYIEDGIVSFKSDVILVAGDYNNAIKMARLSYKFFSPEKIEKIPDMSNSLLQKTAIHAIKTSTSCNKIRQGMLSQPKPEDIGKLNLDALLEELKGFDGPDYSRN